MDTEARKQELLLPRRRPVTRLEFERAVETGLYGPEERLELIEGVVVEKMTPQKSTHSTAILACEEALRASFRTGCHVRVQLPLALGDLSEPEPDLAVVAGGFRDYAAQHPTTAVLVVEVADATLAYDRSTKGPLYARAGVPEYWIVNLPDRMLEVHREPAAMAEQPLGHHYRSITRYTEGATVVPGAAPDQAVRVADLLP